MDEQGSSVQGAPAQSASKPWVPRRMANKQAADASANSNAKQPAVSLLTPSTTPWRKQKTEAPAFDGWRRTSAVKDGAARPDSEKTDMESSKDSAVISLRPQNDWRVKTQQRKPDPSAKLTIEPLVPGGGSSGPKRVLAPRKEVEPAAGAWRPHTGRWEAREAREGQSRNPHLGRETAATETTFRNLDKRTRIAERQAAGLDLMYRRQDRSSSAWRSSSWRTGKEQPAEERAPPRVRTRQAPRAGWRDAQSAEAPTTGVAAFLQG